MLRLIEYGTAETGFTYKGCWKANPPRTTIRTVKASIANGVLSWELIEGYTTVAATGTIATNHAKLTAKLRKELELAIDSASRNEKD